MGYKDYLERINKRNANLRRYHEKHPEITQHSLAMIFKIDQSRISRILRNGKHES